MIGPGIEMLRIYFFGFVFMALQFAGQSVFQAEPISNVVGGLACYLTMRMTIYKKLEREEKTACGI